MLAYPAEKNFPMKNEIKIKLIQSWNESTVRYHSCFCYSSQLLYLFMSRLPSLCTKKAQYEIKAISECATKQENYLFNFFQRLQIQLRVFSFFSLFISQTRFHCDVIIFALSISSIPDMRSQFENLQRKFILYFRLCSSSCCFVSITVGFVDNAIPVIIYFKSFTNRHFLFAISADLQYNVICCSTIRCLADSVGFCNIVITVS